ncbi:MAG: hypothetical protein KGJ02_01105 [Verrucomicrobiota bacterium]|nr:hypothetical protein [Verrucomicrobiota bacterium]
MTMRISALKNVLPTNVFSRSSNVLFANQMRSVSHVTAPVELSKWREFAVKCAAWTALCGATGTFIGIVDGVYMGAKEYHICKEPGSSSGGTF